MKEEFIMQEWRPKQLRKAAFAVGFGLYFGKRVAKFIDETVSGTIVNIFKTFAKEGNEFCKDVCEKNGIHYKEEPKKNDNDVKMGFHV